MLEVIKHTEKEYTFRMAFEGEVRPGQFFEVSVPKYGEAPISVSGIVPGESVDLTIRRVGRVTIEMFDTYGKSQAACDVMLKNTINAALSMTLLVSAVNSKQYRNGTIQGRTTSQER